MKVDNCRLKCETITHDISFEDPARFGYPRAMPYQVVDRIPVRREILCEVRLTDKQANRVKRRLDNPRAITITHEGTRLTGFFQLEHDEVGFILRGMVSKIRLAAT